MKSPLVSSFLFCALLTAAPSTFAASGQATNPAKHIPLTTTSEAARRAFQGGLENLQLQQTERARIDFRSAARADADFALAHLFIAYDDGDPAEEKTELAKAETLASNASKPEQLMVQWLAGSREGQMVPAIAALNDLVATYPEDKFLLYLAGRWMVQHRNYEAAQSLLERAIALDPDYPAALNELGYAYADTYNFDRAFKALDKYVKLQPGEPNTEDSYGEICRKSGRYDQALEHYRKALSYDEKFYWSQVGLADTYMLMGRETQARAEYAKAIAVAPSAGERLAWEISSAITYAYDNDSRSFFDEMQKVADEASAIHIGVQEAAAYHLMAMYSRDPKAYGLKAEAAISRSAEVSAADHDQQLALLLRTQAIDSAMVGNQGSTSEALQHLQKLALDSRSDFIETCSEAAQGAVLFVQKKYADAIPHLEEDQLNPLSAARLVVSYRVTGDNYRADEQLEHLSQYHEPTLEDLLARRLLNEQGPRKQQ